MKLLKNGVVAALSLAVVAPSFATVDLTTLTGAITATDFTVGVLAVAAVLAVVYVTMSAAKTVLRMLRSA